MFAVPALLLLAAAPAAPARPAPVRIDPVPCASAILVDVRSGAVLHEQDADVARAPASLVKMMVQLLVLQEIAEGGLSLSDSVLTSRNAATMGGSQVYLKEGEVQTVHALLQAVAIASANDAAVALAERVAGSEAAFVERMNRKALRLGCRSTHFTNVHGLDLRRQERAVTTARDLSIIARALLQHPLALELASTRRAPFRGGVFWLDNTNKLLGRCEGVDGLKTGWNPRAGACLAATAERDGARLLTVVLGAPGGTGRFDVSRELLDAGFAARRVLAAATAGPGPLLELPTP